MKSIVPKPFWLVPLVTLALFGAGCLSPEAEPTPAPAPVPTPEQPTPSAPAPSAPTSSDSAPAEPTPSAPSGYELPEIDATWQTYTNKALGFSFRYPTKSRYAPEWEMKIAREGDASMQDGCYVDEQTDSGTEKRVMINGREFCRTHAVDPAAGSRYYTYHYATKFGSSYAILSFTKRAVNGDNYEEPACHGKIVFSFGGCVEFVQADFEAQLDQIMGTFVEIE